MSYLNELLRRRRDERGFTLVELLVVIVILAVLAAIVLPKFADSSKRSKEAALRSDLKLMRNAVGLFKSDLGYYPDTLADLAEPNVGNVKCNVGGTSTNASPPDWHGPYLQADTNDPISNTAFTYDNETGSITSSASGTAMNGTNYSDW